MTFHSQYLEDLSIYISYYLSAIIPLLPKNDENINDMTKIIVNGGGSGRLEQYVFEKTSNTWQCRVDPPENLIRSYLNLKETEIPVIAIKEYSEGFQGVVLLPKKA